jgi:hypothetical protein
MLRYSLVRATAVGLLMTSCETLRTAFIGGGLLDEPVFALSLRLFDVLIVLDEVDVLDEVAETMEVLVAGGGCDGSATCAMDPNDSMLQDRSRLSPSEYVLDVTLPRVLSEKVRPLPPPREENSVQDETLDILPRSERSNEPLVEVDELLHGVRLSPRRQPRQTRALAVRTDERRSVRISEHLPQTVPPQMRQWCFLDSMPNLALQTAQALA